MSDDSTSKNWGHNWLSVVDLEGDEASYDRYEARKDEPDALRELPLPQNYSGYKIYAVLGFGNIVIPTVGQYYKRDSGSVVPVHPAAAFLLDRGNDQQGGWSLAPMVDLYGFSLEHPIEVRLEDIRAESPLCRRFESLIWNIMQGAPGRGPIQHENPSHDPKNAATGPAVIDMPGQPHGEPLVSRFAKVMKETGLRGEQWQERRNKTFVDSALILPPGARGEKQEIVTATAAALPASEQ